jgi:hypothetical protein
MGEVGAWWTLSWAGAWIQEEDWWACVGMWEEESSFLEMVRI